MSLKIQPDFSGAACGQAEVAEPWLTPVVDCCHSSGSRGKLSRLKEWSLKTPVVLPRWLSGKKKKKKKNPPANARGMGSIPGSGRSSGEGSGIPLQYSCLESPMDRGVLQATILEATEELDVT